jgi:AcrR family transcriptional regulator
MAKASAKIHGAGRTAILDTAEELFAQSGFDGVPIREVAKKANVALSLVTYHFPSKEQLIDAVITRRSDAVVAARRKELHKFIQEDSRDVNKFVEAFTKPFVDLIGSGDEGWRNFGEIVAQTTHSTKYGPAFTKHYDHMARMFADTLSDIYGHADPEKAIRAILFCASVMLGAFAATRRLEAISEGRYSSGPNDTYPLMLKFIAGGIEKIMTE